MRKILLVLVLSIAFLPVTVAKPPMWKEGGDGLFIPPGQAKKLEFSPPVEPAVDPVSPVPEVVPDVETAQSGPPASAGGADTEPETQSGSSPEQVAQPEVAAQDRDAVDTAENALGPIVVSDDGAPAHPLAKAPSPGAIPIANAGFGGNALMAAGFLGAMAGALGARGYGRRRTERLVAAPKGPVPAPDPLSLGSLLRRVDLNPFDGEARFHLAVQLMGHGREPEALRHLTQAFRYYPKAILDVLKEPALAPLRNHAEVRQILRRYQRDASRRLWTGYT